MLFLANDTMTIVYSCVVDENSYKALLEWKIVKCEVENTI